MKVKRKFDKGLLFSIILGIVCGTLLGMFTPNPFKKSEQKIDNPKVAIEEESTNVITKDNRNIATVGTIPFNEERFEEIGRVHTSDERVLMIETYSVDKFTGVVYYTSMIGVSKGDIITSIAFPLFNADGTPVTKDQFINNTYKKY